MYQGHYFTVLNEINWVQCMAYRKHLEHVVAGSSTKWQKDMQDAMYGTHQRAAQAAQGNAASGIIKTLTWDCSLRGIGRDFQSEALKDLEIHVIINTLNI